MAKITEAVFVVIISFGITGCSSSLIASYDNWDMDGDNILSAHEFNTGYSKSNFFKKWSKKKSITYSNFYSRLFTSADYDNDRQLTSREFSSKLLYFIRGIALDDFSKWDNDSNSILNEMEFMSKIKTVSVADRWDTSMDGRISEQEFADQMFKLADVNSDGFVNIVEFNIWNANR
jgi:Ca2+-binding EF-hand superfamily protein